MKHKVKIKHRYSDTVLWSGEVEAPKDTFDSRLLGLAVIEAIKNGAYLSGADMRGADMRDADLFGANLRGADLFGADLRGANLRGADLFGANLRGADLFGANLRGADLRGADLFGLKLIARASRADYEFILWSSVLGGHIIRAGCRTMTIPEYRAHVAAEYPGTGKAEETLAILDYLEGRLNKFLGD